MKSGYELITEEQRLEWDDLAKRTTANCYN